MRGVERSAMSMHNAIVHGICTNEGAARTGWRRQMRALGRAIEDDEWVCLPYRLPDAFRIDEPLHDNGVITQNGKITVWEVEISNPLTPVRVMEWARMWEELGDFAYDLRLVTVDRYGCFREPDLLFLYYTWCLTQADRSVD